MSPVFRKPIARKSAFEPKETDNLLFPEVKMSENGPNKLKLLLQCTPTQVDSHLYEKYFMPWDGQTVEGYCKFRSMLENYIRNAPLVTVTEQVNAEGLLLAGTPKTN